MDMYKVNIFIVLRSLHMLYISSHQLELCPTTEGEKYVNKVALLLNTCFALVCENLVCFSNRVKYDTFDILADEEVRQGLKAFSNWPTYPQLYVKGELLGGLDIIKVRQLHFAFAFKVMVYGESLF